LQLREVKPAVKDSIKVQLMRSQIAVKDAGRRSLKEVQHRNVKQSATQGFQPSEPQKVKPSQAVRTSSYMKSRKLIANKAG